jgi:uncharacterized membrane protein YkvA (DUF1232 family)
MTINAMNTIQALHLTARVAEKASHDRGELRGVWDELQALLRLVRAWAQGRYRKVTWKTVGIATGALVYFLNPFDAVPDFLPGVGYLDDATVIALAVASIRGEVHRFLAWESTETAGGTADTEDTEDTERSEVAEAAR